VLHRRGKVVAAFILGALLFGACGSSGSSAKSDDQAKRSAASSATTTTTPAAAGIWVAAQIADASVVQQTAILTSTDGKRWNQTATLDATIWSVAFGDGKWLATGDFVAGTTAGKVFESTDLVNWTPVETAPGTALRSLAYGDGRWTGVGLRVGSNSSTSNVIMTSTDAKAWTDVATLPGSLDAVGYGDGTWIATTSQFANRVSNMRTVTSSDGLQWKQTGSGLADVTTFTIAYGDGGWLLGGRPSQQPNAGLLAQSTDGAAWAQIDGAAIAQRPVRALAYGSSGWLGVMDDAPAPGDEHGNATATFFTSSDGTTWTRASHIDRSVSSVAYGRAPTASTAATTTTVAKSGGSDDGAIEKVDWENYSYMDRVCDTNKLQKLDNGSWSSSGTPAFTCGMNFTRVGYGDVNGDGAQDAVVTINNNASGTARGESYTTYVYTLKGGQPELIGTLNGEGFPPYAAGGIDVWNRFLGPNDPVCCPTQYQITTYKFANATFAEAGSRKVPADQYPGGNG
jgi:hypothetical protein